MSFFLELNAWVERQHQITLSKSWFTQHLLPQFHCTPCWMHANERSSLLRFWFLRVKLWFYEFFPWLSYLGSKKTSNYKISGWVYQTFITIVSWHTLLKIWVVTYAYWGAFNRVNNEVVIINIGKTQPEMVLFDVFFPPKVLSQRKNLLKSHFYYKKSKSE